MTRIAIVGAGVVGTATGDGLLKHGHDVTFVDISPNVVARLSSGGRHAVMSDEFDLASVEQVWVSVTALTNEDGIDLTHLKEATRTLGEKLAVSDTQPIIVYRCTMLPGTIESILTPLLEKVSGKTADQDFHVAYNPEYLRAEPEYLGTETALDDFLHPRLVLIASFEEGNYAHQAVYDVMSKFGGQMAWLPFDEAQIQKYFNNVGNAAMISVNNGFRLVGAEMGVRTDRAIDLCAISAESHWNPVYGTRNRGDFGGECLPKDTKALQLELRRRGIRSLGAKLIDLILDINETMKKGK